MTGGDKWVICLCDLTGVLAEPWLAFDYNVLLVDPQHTDYGSGRVFKFPGTVLEAMPFISWLIQSRQVSLVAAFPPCTEVAVSGARWWAEKFQADPYFQAKAALVAEQCRTIGEVAGCPWFFENPVSAFSSIFGPSSWSFDPFDYSAYAEEDQYLKRTHIWAGGGLVQPLPRQRGALGAPDNRIHMMPGSADQANNRSATPRGFAIALFLANCPEVAE